MAHLAFYCSSSSKGGLELNLLRLAKWMSKNHQVSVWVVPNSALHHLAIELSLKTEPIILANKYFDLKEAYSLSLRFQKRKVEAVLSSLNRDIDVLAWTKAFSLKAFKLIFFQQMLFPVMKKSFIHNYRFSKIDAWLAPTDFLLNQVKNNTNIPFEKLIKVPLCIEIANFENAKSRKEEVLKEWNLPSNRNYIGLLGRLDPMKGQALLIEAFAPIANKHSTYDVLLVGEASLHLKTDAYSKIIGQLINRYNLKERIRFLPFTQEPYKFFAVADVFVLGSHEEAYGMVTIEALTSGTPVIASNTGSSPELLENGEKGFLYQAKNAQDLSHKLEALLINFDQVSQKAFEEKERFAAKFSHQNEVAQIENILKQWGLS